MKKLISALLFLSVALGVMAAPAQVDTIFVETNHIAMPAKAVVAFPEQYFSEGDATRYPTVYLLHGYSDDYSYYAHKMDLAEAATRYGVIFVCPDGRDSWYWDSPVNPQMQMESFITEDLVPAIDSNYRTIPDASKRAIVGLSMGGQGSFWLAVRHPDIWKNVGSMSGGVDITRPKFHKSWKMAKSLGPYVSNPGRWKEHSTVELVKTLDPGTLNIIFTCGTSDFFYQVNCDLDRELNARKIGHTYITGPGDHSWKYWGRMLPVILDFFNMNFRN